MGAPRMRTIYTLIDLVSAFINEGLISTDELLDES